MFAKALKNHVILENHVQVKSYEQDVVCFFDSIARYRLWFFLQLKSCKANTHQVSSKNSKRHTLHRQCAGFTMVELSVVLVVIGVILGAVSLGSDVLRNAKGQRIFTDFVTGWSNAFASYTALSNTVPGDSFTNPTYVIKAPDGSLILCNTPGAPDLTNAFLLKSIALPGEGTPGQEDRHVYQDSNGSPHELRICLLTTPWAVPGTSSGNYVLKNRHVMQITGLTTELAMQLDTLIDGRQDQRFGHFRSIAESANIKSAAAGVTWPPVKLASGEDNIGEVQAYLELN